MILVPDEDMASWVEDVCDGFDWDDGNREKNMKHHVSTDEIEEVVLLEPLFAGRIIEPSHTENRWLILGITEQDRLLALIFCRRGNLLRPISCRPMRIKERQLYNHMRGISDEQTRH